MPPEPVQPAVRRPITIGVLGCADIAARRALPAIAGSSFHLAAVASRTRDKAEGIAARFDCKAVEGYAALLEMPDVDAVYIPLPNNVHSTWARRALAAGKHVLVEKPAALDAGEAAELAALAEARGLALMENFAFLQHPQHELAQSLVADGAVGEIRAFGGFFGIPPTPPDGIRYQAGLAGGSLSEVGCYPVRAAQLFCEPAIEVLGAAWEVDRGLGVDVAGSAHLRGANGVVATCTFGLSHSYRSTYDVWGSRGRLILDWAFTPSRDARPVLRLQQQDRETRYTAASSDQFVGTMNAFHDSVVDPAIRARHRQDLVQQAELLARIRSAAQS